MNERQDATPKTRTMRLCDNSDDHMQRNSLLYILILFLSSVILALLLQDLVCSALLSTPAT
jgi:hypothetical protein